MVTRRMRHVYVAAWLIAGLFAVACSRGTPLQSQQASEVRLNVVSANSILGDWARQVGGEGVQVVDLVPPGVDPHSFQPGAKDIVGLANADLALFVGLNLEGQWIREVITNVEVEGASHLALGMLADPIRVGDEADPHFWMDPIRVKAAVSAIAEKLTEIDPDHGDEYRDNAMAYTQKLDDLHLWINVELQDVPPDDRILVTSHDSLGYFAERYGFRVVGAVIPGVSTERDPSASEMANLVDAIRQYDAEAIFVEASVSDRMAQRISEETGVPVVGGLMVGTVGPVDSDTGTYESMMRRNVEIIAGALR